MRIEIAHGNLAELDGDAVVNSADSSLLGGCGVDEAVHRAAGPELLEECRTLGGCETGHAKITGAYGMRCKYIIHTVAPTWRGGLHGERRQLASCYRTCLELAMDHGCRTVSFPLLAAGSRGYPKDKALRIAMEAIDTFLARHDGYELKVYLVIYDRSDYQINPRLFQRVAAYLNRHCLTPGPWKNAEPAADQGAGTRRRWLRWPSRRDQARSADSMRKEAPRQKAERTRPDPPPAAGPDPSMPSQQPGIFPSAGTDASVPPPSCCQKSSELPPSYYNQVCYGQAAPPSLNDMLEHLDEGFSQTLMRLIDQKGLSDVQCYKRANIDRKLFSKIRSNRDYRPSKPTVLAFAVALELTLDETESLLRRAGFALSHANAFDVIVEFFISQGCFDIMTINESLFAFDQHLLGG